MTVKEALGLLKWSKDTYIAATTRGIELPKSKELCKLEVDSSAAADEITEEALDTFLAAFEAEEPGRHPPTKVRRELAVEANHRCGVCRDASPLQFHHIIEWNEIKHYDTTHMMAVCGSCHDRMRTGEIDRRSQYIYKRKLQEAADREAAGKTIIWGQDADPLPWQELAEVINALHETIPAEPPTDANRFDFNGVHLESIKNPLNKLNHDYFRMMCEIDEPHFYRISSFLQLPSNRDIKDAYHEIVDDLKRRIALAQQTGQTFESILGDLRDTAIKKFGSRLIRRKATLNKLLSFMYFNCDIGRKTP